MEATLQPRIPAISEAEAVEILIGTREDFWKLIFNPVELAYCSRISFINKIKASSAGMIIKVSSAYRMTGKLASKLGEKGALNRLALKALLIAVVVVKQHMP
jgi:hypothetical protein